MEEREERVRTRVVELAWAKHQFPYIGETGSRAEHNRAEQNRTE